MNNGLKMLIGLGGCAFAAACDVDKTKEGKLPDVEVNASGGQLPEYNVEGPTVTVGSENKTVEVPTVDVEPANKD